jgi:flagellar basal body-associated protein FliL
LACDFLQPATGWLERPSGPEGFMLVIIFLAIAVALLVVVGMFAWMQKDKGREGQSGSPGTASIAKHGRATDPDD